MRVGADESMRTQHDRPEGTVGIEAARGLSYNVRRMSLRDIRRHVGQLAIVGFAGHTIPAELAALAREFDLGGVIFFARNVAEPEQVADLSREAQELAARAAALDQRGPGGRTGRAAEARRSPSGRPWQTLGRSGDDALAARFARALAAELRAVGISLDYTPVLDVHTNPKNPVIGDRALAERADDVARLGSAIIRTLQGAGIAACGKHFPGHGDTSVDSHFELPLRRASAGPARGGRAGAVQGARSRRTSPRS